MNAWEAFQRAYQDGRDREHPAELTDWKWLEEQVQEAENVADPVRHGYCLGRLSHRGECVTDDYGMVYAYDAE